MPCVLIAVSLQAYVQSLHGSSHTQQGGRQREGEGVHVWGKDLSGSHTHTDTHRHTQTHTHTHTHSLSLSLSLSLSSLPSVVLLFEMLAGRHTCMKQHNFRGCEDMANHLLTNSWAQRFFLPLLFPSFSCCCLQSLLCSFPHTQHKGEKVQRTHARIHERIGGT